MENRNPLAPVRAEFQCTRDEFIEATLGDLAGRSGKPTASGPWSGLLGWGITGGMLCVLLLFEGLSAHAQQQQFPPAPRGFPLILRCLIALSPTLFLCAVSALQVLHATIEPPMPWRQKSLSRLAAGIRVIAMVATTGTILFVAFDARSLWTEWTGQKLSSPIWPREYEYVLPLGIWGCLMLLMTLFQVVNRTFVVRRRWADQPILQRPHRLVADDQGVTLVAEGSFSHWYNWSLFTGFRETSNLIILYVATYSFWVIPKRGFSSTDELGRFKALLVEMVKAGVLLPGDGAFPVIQTAPA